MLEQGLTYDSASSLQTAKKWIDDFMGYEDEPDEAEWIDLILLMEQFYINKVEAKKNAGNNRKH
jgi:hypothetical protein